MLAFGLCLALFTFWTLLGLAVVRPLEGRGRGAGADLLDGSDRSERLDGLRQLLVAPPVGMAVHGLPLFLLNLAGLPVRTVALPLAAVLALAALVSVWRFRPAIPWRAAMPFLLFIGLALVLTGRPMFLFDFDWVSFCNDDMANYCLGAQRVLDHGYFHRPTPEQLFEGRDYVQQMWFLHVPGMHRPGSEMIIAFLCGLTNKEAPEVFMIVILAMHLCQVSAIAALVYRSRDTYWPAVASCGLVSLSALASLGALYQLIAQVSGLSLAIAGGVLLLRPMEAGGFKAALRGGTLIGIVIAGLMVFYPEVFPFLALTWLIYTVLGVARRRLPVKPLLARLAVGTVVTVVLLNFYTGLSLTYLLMQAGTGTRIENVQRTLFPYYLLPTGFSNLWGFQPLATIALEPWQSLGIACGMLLFLFAAVAALRWTWRGDANATFALVMVVMGVYLFVNRSGFGLYKLAMYAQPFLLAVVVTFWLAIVGYALRRVTIRLASGGGGGLGLRQAALVGVCALVLLLPLAAMGTASWWTQDSYVTSSCGVGQTFNEILDASDSRVYNEFREKVEGIEQKRRAENLGPAEARYLLDTYNLVGAKFQSLGVRQRQLAFPSNRFYYPGGYKRYPAPGGHELLAAASELMGHYRRQFEWRAFVVNPDAAKGLRPDTVLSPDDAAAGAGTGVGVGVGVEDTTGDAANDEVGDGDATNTFLFNKLAAEMAGSVDGDQRSPEPPGNGEVYIVGTTGKQSPFNRRHLGAEADYNFVIRPASEVQNHLIFISSELGHPYFAGGRIKPYFAIYQLETEPEFFRGSTMAGVGRYVLFQVVNPSTVASAGDADGNVRPKPSVRMMLEMTASYKADADNTLPPAQAVGNGRANFQGLMEVPREGGRWPGLKRRGAARVVSEPLEPQIINGQAYVSIDMGVEGKQFPVQRKYLMRLYGMDVAIDRRTLVGFLRDCSLVSEQEYASFQAPVELSSFGRERNHLRNHKDLEYSGIYEDGWVSESSFCKLRQAYLPTATAVVRGEVPLISDPYYEAEVELLVDGQVVATQTVHPGSFELRGETPAPAAGTATATATANGGVTRTIELRFSRHQALPTIGDTPDGRPVAAKLLYIGFEGKAATSAPPVVKAEAARP